MGADYETHEYKDGRNCPVKIEKTAKVTTSTAYPSLPRIKGFPQIGSFQC